VGQTDPYYHVGLLLPIDSDLLVIIIILTRLIIVEHERVGYVVISLLKVGLFHLHWD
jgi:hypothetical protein